MHADSFCCLPFSFLHLYASRDAALSLRSQQYNSYNLNRLIQLLTKVKYSQQELNIRSNESIILPHYGLFFFLFFF